MVREILVRCFRYKVVSSEMMLLIVLSGGSRLSLDCAAMVCGRPRELRDSRSRNAENLG